MIIIWEILEDPLGDLSRWLNDIDLEWDRRSITILPFSSHCPPGRAVKRAAQRAPRYEVRFQGQDQFALDKWLLLEADPMKFVGW